MFKGSIILASLIFTSAASAQGGAHQCDIKGWGDFSVEINWESKKAALFDNDNWSVIPFKHNDLLAYEVVFEGLDNYGDNLKISYDYSGMITPPQHRVEFVADGKNQQVFMSCETVQPSELNSDI